MKLKELRAIEPSLAKLLNATLEIKVSYRLMKLAKVVKTEFENMEGFRQKLIEKYGVKDEKGTLIKYKSEQGEQFQIDDVDSFNKEWAELMEVEFDLPDVHLTINNIEEANKLGAKISPIDLANLEFLIEQPKE